ncbi:MAG: hypothetical protein GXO39_02645 [Thermotogae bacterium]|nr:hypothetical protein [Thermotogota bacterium]
MILLLSVIPNDLEILYAAVDSACAKGCILSKNVVFSGMRIPPSVTSYIRLRYGDTTLSCTTYVNVMDIRVVYGKHLWMIERTATFRALVKGCGFGKLLSGMYRDRLMPYRLDEVKVEGISPNEVPSGSLLEMILSGAVVFGVLYAFYTIEGR